MLKHPFLSDIVSEVETLESQLSILIAEKKSEVANDFEVIVDGIKYKKFQLTMLAKHKREDFKSLLNVLHTKVVCPFCFIYHGHLVKLKLIETHPYAGKLECGVCDKRFDNPKSF